MAEVSSRWHNLSPFVFTRTYAVYQIYRSPILFILPLSHFLLKTGMTASQVEQKKSIYPSHPLELVVQLRFSRTTSIIKMFNLTGIHRTIKEKIHVILRWNI